MQEESNLERDLKIIQDIGFEALLALQETCTRLGIRLYLDGGTLLGAVRSGDIIPWDDDIDVMMRRDEYEILRKNRSCLPPHLNLIDPRDRRSSAGSPVLVDERQWVTRRGSRLGLVLREHQKIGVDIFVLDSPPKGKLRYTSWLYTVRALEILRYIRALSVSDLVGVCFWRSSLGLLVASIRLLITPLRNSWLGSTLVFVSAKAFVRRPSTLQCVGRPSWLKDRQYSAEWFSCDTVILRGHSFSCPSGYEFLITTYGSDWSTPHSPDEAFNHGTRLSDGPPRSLLGNFGD